MNVKEAIKAAAESFRAAGNLTPSHCAVRCTVNDLTSDNDRVSHRGYDQNRAWVRVRRLLGNPVKLSDSPNFNL